MSEELAQAMEEQVKVEEPLEGAVLSKNQKKKLKEKAKKEAAKLAAENGETVNPKEETKQ